MSNTVKDGCTAFPLPASEYGGNGPEWGMSLRDYFAAQAMRSFIELVPTEIWNQGIGIDPKFDSALMAANAAYAMADAMLRAREKKKTDEPTASLESYCKPECPEVHREYGTSDAQANGGPYKCRKCGLHMPF